MSCLDVMYPAYGHYAPYQSATPAFISSLQAQVGHGSPPPHPRGLMERTRTPEATEGAASSYPSSARPKDKQEAPEAEYLSARCVLFTYYQGDISSVVDEHFSRALSSYMEGEGKRRALDLGTGAPSPGNRHCFPPSFWDSNYPSPPGRSHCELATPSYSMEPYSSSLHTGLAPPHAHAAEAWGYGQSQAYGPPRSLHQLYSPAGLEPHYRALLVPTVRPAHLTTLAGHYDVSKLEPTSTWPGLLPPGDMAQTLDLNMDSGLPHHKKGKELYWF